MCNIILHYPIQGLNSQQSANYIHFNQYLHPLCHCSVTQLSVDKVEPSTLISFYLLLESKVNHTYSITEQNQLKV